MPEKEKKSEKVIQREILYKWTAPMRSFQKLDKKKFWSIAIAVLALFVVLAILGQYGLMLAIAALMFLVYVLGTIPPENVNHLVTTLGVETIEKQYKWERLGEYWFSEKDGQKLLNIDTRVAFPSRLIMLVGAKDMNEVHKLLKERLRYKDLRDQKAFDKLSEGEWINLLEKEKPVQK